MQTPFSAYAKTIHSAILSLFFVLSPGLTSAPAADVDFNRDIRPILSNHCFQCHGPDDDSREADLRLDERESALHSSDSNPAIVPGKPEESEILRRITSADADEKMPPEEFNKPLSARQIRLLSEWISQGADYEAHWSFQPVTRPDPPPTSVSVRTPIDAFVLNRLAGENIEPSPAADRYTLIRRVYLDLLGLPPTVEEVDRFVSDKSDDAWQKLIDRVLASPHFGERWGRHWLDQARYADSHGYTNDNERSIWPYRDWVIDAFNRDLPFDRFTIEQLAGDLLDSPTLAQRVATGFHRNTLINTEGGTKADQFRDEQVKDRVDTTGLVWMGLTVGCAKCHTHKYDPLSQHEYYQLYAFFNSTTDANSVTPTLKVPSSEQTQRIADLRASQDSLRKQIAADRGRADRQAAWEQQILAEAKQSNDGNTTDPYNWQVLELSPKSQVGSELESLDDKSVLVVKGNGDNPDEYHCVCFDKPELVRSVRLEVLTHESLPKNGPGRAGNGNFVLSEFWFRTGDGRELRFNSAGADHSQPKYPVSAAIDGKDDTGWAINGAPEGSMNRNRTAWFVLPTALKLGGDSMTFKLQFHQKNYGIGRFRISVSDKEWQDNPDASALAPLVAIVPSERSTEQQQKLDAAFLKQDSVLGPLDAALAKATKDLADVQRAIPSTMVLQELEKSRTTHLQIRGEFLRTADEVTEQVPAVLPAMKPAEGRRTRLDFAEWLTQPNHPLTARVRVNRIWMRLFGKGLVETENDFGIQGTLPSHPELLDWLASEFVRLEWSQKALLRLILNSDIYRRSSAARSDLETIDPRNLLLARQNRIRVEAEIVRDIALAISRRLSAKIGGPSVYPPQEQGVYAFTQRKKSWNTDRDEDRYRRGMYTFFYRSAPYPMLETFDVPKFNATCTRRDRSNTPLQSLTVANSESIFELAEAFGQRIHALAETSDDEKIGIAFRDCFARPPSRKEVTILTRYLEQSRERFTEDDKAWTAVARLLFNLDEFITRE